MRRRLRRTTCAVAVAAACIFSAPGQAPGFQVWRHVCMSEQMLELEKIEGPALELIKVGTYMPDVAECLGFCYCPESVKVGGRCLWSPHEPDRETILGQLSQRHFDNVRIPASQRSFARRFRACIGVSPPGRS